MLSNKVSNFFLSNIPYDVKLGPYYSYLRRLPVCKSSPYPDPSSIFNRLKSIVSFAYRHNAFYRSFYDENSFHPSQLSSFEDYDRIPIVTRSSLQAHSLEFRSSFSFFPHLLNTGGSSGQPLVFPVDFFAFAREWGFMHSIWASHGYSSRQLKLTFRGKHFSSDLICCFNPVHNELVFNSSSSIELLINFLFRNLHIYYVKWIHGYPSFVSEFARILSHHTSPQSAIFKSRIKGVLLGSEFPAPLYRSIISENLSANIISWFGNSEQTVLAQEVAINQYHSFPLYSYVEAIPSRFCGPHRLITTSYYNRAHPFIRYDTGDLVRPLFSSCGYLCFSVVEGRTGDFILDKSNSKVWLTSFVFGRHHPSFGLVSHFQIHQPAPGFAIVYVVLNSSTTPLDLVVAGFDFSGLDISFSFEVISTPFRSQRGKVPLLVSANLVS